MAISPILFYGSQNAHNDRVRCSNPLRFDCSRQPLIKHGLRLSDNGDGKISESRVGVLCADRVPWRGVARRGMNTAISGVGRVDQAVTADSLTIGSSLKGAIVSRLM